MIPMHRGLKGVRFPAILTSCPGSKAGEHLLNGGCSSVSRSALSIIILSLTRLCIGPLVHFRSYLRRFVVLNTAEAVNDLLEKRSALYSDRPMSWMLFNLCGREMTVFNISSLHPRHRKYRRIMHVGLGSSAIEEYWPLMQKETREMVQGFWSTPQLYEEHIRR